MSLENVKVIEKIQNIKNQMNRAFTEFTKNPNPKNMQILESLIEHFGTLSKSVPYALSTLEVGDSIVLAAHSAGDVFINTSKKHISIVSDDDGMRIRLDVGTVPKLIKELDHAINFLDIHKNERPVLEDHLFLSVFAIDPKDDEKINGHFDLDFLGHDGDYHKLISLFEKFISFMNQHHNSYFSIE